MSDRYKEELLLEGVWSISAICSQLLKNRVGQDTASDRGLQNNTRHSHFEQNVVNLPVETFQERNESPESLTAGCRHHPALREETNSLHRTVLCNQHICIWGQASCQERVPRRDDC